MILNDSGMSTETAADKIAFKNRLKAFCMQTIEQRIISARKIIDNAQDAANSEEKSSAGDKYETSRAMNHLEKDMHSRQMQAHIIELNHCVAINTNKLYQGATAGAMIVCREMAFFLAAGLGKQSIDGMTILFLSPVAPLAKTIMNKTAGERFLFNGKEMIVEEVY
jgi:hypothetical protein